ncbi:hypothetical protein H2198_002457 [Neophaeococcomyces mojaviensis]|uniref:Uncharacterized protein n=1 Tax=Neophaeococcomyces mojaviensis TaxID=3383035 RepID=A0ACC3AEK7_9EURO|nr:hypothetical protein H2198_002457 [Knufia sp. JES_112]
MKDKKSQPWDNLEFGTSVLKPNSIEHSQHLENARTSNATQPRTETEIAASSTNSTGFKNIENVAIEDRSWSISGLDLPRINSAALAAAQTEHQMSFRDGLRTYPKAIFWSAIISLAIVGEGFDTALINSFFAFDTFRRSYGVQVGDGTYQITTKWQTALNNGSVAGSVIGLLANGWLTERFGYRKTLIGALLSLAAFIFLTFFAFNIETLLAGQILCGLPWGVCSTLAMSYAAEVMPLTLRGYTIANINMCWLWGQLIAQGTMRGLIGDKSEWSYRIPFGIQWAWIVIVIVGAFFAPESPWYLVRKHRFSEAKGSLKRLIQKSQSVNIDNIISMMRHTDEVEKQLNVGKTKRNDITYLECFRGTNLRRSEIACCVFMTQALCLPPIGFAAYFYRQIRFDIRRSFDLSLGMQGLALIGNLVAYGLMKYFGRRRLYLVGLATLFMILLIAGILGSLPESPAILWAIASLILVFIFVFDCTVGPLTYTLVSEVPSTRLRVNTIVLARISYNLLSLVTNLISNHALNSLSWNMKGKANFIWIGTCLLCLVYCYFRVPETRGLTYHELDILFEKRADARKFADIQKRLDETGYFGFYQNNSDANIVWQ